MNGDWKDLPYYRTQVDIAKSMEELRKYVARFPSARGFQYTELPEETTIRILIVLRDSDGEEIEAPVRFTLEPTGDERTDRQQARILAYAVKNWLAAVEAGILTLEEALVGHMETYQGGRPVTLGELMLAQVREAKMIAPPRLGIGPARTGGTA
jgi:hypothetical protein